MINPTKLLSAPQSGVVKELLAYAKNIGIQIEVVVITGGPCAGKTTALARLEIEFKERGWFVVLLPEAATIVRNAGFKAETGVISNYNAQMMMISQNEFSFVQAIAHAIQTGQKKIIIIRDRCSIDGAAYMPSFDEFAEQVRDMGLNTRDLASATTVVHLRSLAVDQQDLYEQLKGNNTARFETVEEARAADRRTYYAYRHFCVKVHEVPNTSTYFDDKVSAMIKLILADIGEPKIESESAFILKGSLDYWESKLAIVDSQRIKIWQFYTLSGERFRKEGFPNGDIAYTVTTKTPTGNPESRLEETRLINSGEYYAAQNGSDFDNSRKPLHKHRYIFSFSDSGDQIHRGELDYFPDGSIGNALRLEVEYSVVKPGLPSFLEGEEYLEVSGLDEYSNASIADGECPKPFG